MVQQRPSVRRELPWLRSGPLHRVDVLAEAELDEFLERFGYTRVELDGSRMTSRLAAHDELARAFGFPDYYGRNWDAFNDCLGDYFEEHAGDLLAVVWRDLAVAAAQAPATAAEVGWALLTVEQTRMPTAASGGWDVATDVFVLGSGEDFDKP